MSDRPSPLFPREQKATNTHRIATVIPKKKKRKTNSAAKTVDRATVEPMQVDEPPAGPIRARFPTPPFGYVKLIFAGTPASGEPERKKKRKKREGASEDNTSKKEKKKRKEVDEPQTTSVSSKTPALASDPSTSEIEEYLQSNSITLTAAKDGPSIKPVLSFDKLQIPQELKTALVGFQHPTPIQACSWPPALQGQDVVGIAETGRYGGVTIVTSMF